MKNSKLLALGLAMFAVFSLSACTQATPEADDAMVPADDSAMMEEKAPTTTDDSTMMDIEVETETE